MKRGVLCLITAVLCLLVCACRSAGQIAVDPPLRCPEVANAMLAEGPFSIEEATAECELIVRVRVQDWLGDNSPLTTKFSARVLEVFKGSCEEEIILFQDGSTQFVFADYPLYCSGLELVLFLKASPDTPNAYRNLGGFATAFYCVEYKGESYLINMTPGYMKADALLTDCSSDALLKTLRKADPVWEKELKYAIQMYAVRLEEVVEKLWK